MFDQLYATLSRAVEGAPGVALGASFVWGILSILLSPCHLASIPLIVGFIDQHGRIGARRAFVVSLLFSVGILASIGLIGVVTASVGRILGDIGPWSYYMVAVVLFAVGLHLMDAIRIPLPAPAQPHMRRKGALAAFVLGFVFGVALGPCTFAFMAPMLAVTMALSATNLVYGILLLLSFGIGHCAVIVLAGTSVEQVQRYLDWNEKSRGAILLKRICGAMVFLGGLYLLYVAR